MSGMTMSRKIMLGFSALAFSTASLPPDAVTTMQPASLRMDLRLAISAGESSTTSAFLAMLELLIVGFSQFSFLMQSLVNWRHFPRQRSGLSAYRQDISPLHHGRFRCSPAW